MSGHRCKLELSKSSLGSDGKELASNAGDLIQPLGGEDALEKGVAIHFNILAWRIPGTEKPGGLQSIGSKLVA